eukprot:GFKZ01009300.1.p1 GENE.GFKZ01009300.1~~GFKZ01009300.1.p1  ORF type:complete len:171 (-),score=12.74 GFKZ01009300.1:1057-1569(-)
MLRYYGRVLQKRMHRFGGGAGQKRPSASGISVGQCGVMSPYKCTVGSCSFGEQLLPVSLLRERDAATCGRSNACSIAVVGFRTTVSRQQNLGQGDDPLQHFAPHLCGSVAVEFVKEVRDELEKVGAKGIGEIVKCRDGDGEYEGRGGTWLGLEEGFCCECESLVIGQVRG